MVCPNKAKPTITPKPTAAACQASLCRVRADRPRVRPRNSGTVPAGSMITSRVTKTSVKNFTARTISAGQGGPRDAGACRGACVFWTGGLALSEPAQVALFPGFFELPLILGADPGFSRPGYSQLSSYGVLKAPRRTAQQRVEFVPRIIGTG